MTESTAKTLIIAAVGTAGALSSLEFVADGRRPPVGVGVGVVVTGVVLLVLAEVAPAFAAGLAALLLVAALLRNGKRLAATLQTVTATP